MFTGIIKDIGEVLELHSGQVTRLRIRSRLDASCFQHGASIAVNGVCLTVVAYEDGVFAVDVVQETLNCTNLDDLESGSRVNLEPALRVGDSLDGHFVTGHVDAVAEVTHFGADFRIKVPQQLSRFLAKKGSVTVNGVSLTIADLANDEVRIALIPETLASTNLSNSTRVNIEVDLLARYLDSLNS